MRSSRARCRSISSWDGATPITPAWTHAGTAIPGSSAERAMRPVELPADEERLGEEVGEEAEAGDDPVHAEVGGLVPDELDLEHVARLCPLDVHRPGQRVSEPEVEAPAVGVRARARQRPVEPVARLERELVAGRDTRHRLEVGVPAVVRGGRGDPHRSSPMRAAAREAAAISSAVHRRGAPSWWSERIASSLPVAEDRRHDLRREAAVGLEHRLERGVVVGGGAVVLDDLPAALHLEHDGLAREVHRALAAERPDAGRERLRDDRERLPRRECRGGA